MKQSIAALSFAHMALVLGPGCGGGLALHEVGSGDEVAPVGSTSDTDAAAPAGSSPDTDAAAPLGDAPDPQPFPPVDVTPDEGPARDEADRPGPPAGSEDEGGGQGPEIEDTPAADGPDDTAPNGSTVVRSRFPEALSCGEVAAALVEVRNTGNATWTREAGYKLGTVDDSDPFHPTTREWLPEEAVIEPGRSRVFEFELTAPDDEGVFTSDWRMVQEGVEWFGDAVSHDIAVTCPPAPAWAYTDAVEESIYASATHVKDHYPQFFDLEHLSDHEKRVIAYDMMTTVINDLRAKGQDASRCVANPGRAEDDPFHWCSDALVVGPAGRGVTVDIYRSWSHPATPQTHVTTPNATGVVTEDLVPLP